MALIPEATSCTDRSRPLTASSSILAVSFAAFPDARSTYAHTRARTERHARTSRYIFSATEPKLVGEVNYESKVPTDVNARGRVSRK